MQAPSLRTRRISLGGTDTVILPANRRRLVLWFGAETGIEYVVLPGPMGGGVINGVLVNDKSGPVVFRWYSDPEIVQAEWHAATNLGPADITVIEVTLEGL